MTAPQDASRPAVSLERARTEALDLIERVPEGDDLDGMTDALIHLAVHSSVCTLDPDGMDRWIRRALDTGASAAQVNETLMVASGLGVHTLMEGTRRLAAALRERGDRSPDAPLDDEGAALRRRRQGDDPFWAGFEREIPGFLDALLRQSPEAYEAFFDYCAVPWRTGTVPAVAKELMSMACDATPTHRYLPGLRLHLANAVRLGAGRRAVGRTLDIAATAPTHPGIAAADPGG